MNTTFFFIIFFICVVVLNLLVYLKNKKDKIFPHVKHHSSSCKEKVIKTDEEITSMSIDDKSQKNKEWANKMAECRRQKKIDTKKKFEDVGAHIISIPNKYTYNIVANENISTKALFALYDGYFWFCDITDDKGEKLLKITLKRHSCKIEFIQENKEAKIFEKENAVSYAESFLYCYLNNRKTKRIEKKLNNIIYEGVTRIQHFTCNNAIIENKILEILNNSLYDFTFRKNVEISLSNDFLIINYDLPTMSSVPKIIKEYKHIASTNEIREIKHSDKYINDLYEKILYSIVLRSIYEAFYADIDANIQSIIFNGFISAINPTTGIINRNCILSIQVNRDQFKNTNLQLVDPKLCFKSFKGVSASKLSEISPITPILQFDKEDKRFVKGKQIYTNHGTNLAAMHWEDFEQLVRELFEMEFTKIGGDVKITQASRDGGVDAVIFDPDPLRGGKIVVQAKRYTNTVGVSAVRDLYGTIINEGANSGILITTSDYGSDSYEFAKDKPIKLLNGGHLLALLNKHGKQAYINIEEAKKIMQK